MKTRVSRTVKRGAGVQVLALHIVQERRNTRGLGLQELLVRGVEGNVPWVEPRPG